MPVPRTSRLKRLCGFTALLFSAVLCLITSICFIGVWDHVSAITTFPQWSWAALGILSAIIAWRLLGIRARLPALLLTGWLLAMFAFADNLRPVLRGLAHGSAPRVPD